MRYSIRKLRNHGFTLLCLLAFALMTLLLGSLVWTLLKNGIAGLFHSGFFTKTTPAPGMPGGMINAIIGSLLLTVIAIVIATPLGLLVATYLSEFSAGKKLATVIRFANDVLLSAPSIVIGLFCYAVMVRPMQHFSAIAGAVALAIIALPIIVRTAEDMLAIVPRHLREAALALGAPYWRVLTQIVMRSVFHGLLTGILLAFARLLGETAPLLFTSLNNQFWSTSLNKPIASLPVVIYQYAMSPYPDWQQLAWGGALLITSIITALSLIAKKFAAKNKRL